MPLRIFALDIKVGDIVLQPLHCWTCSLIEAQTQSEYSHIGVVVEISNDQVWVAEAYQKVQVLSLAEFNSKTQKGIPLKIMRPSFVPTDFKSIYFKHFDGLPYDAKFLWSDEKIYCSELIYKLFELAKMTVPKPAPMIFDINRQWWKRYFHGQIPDGEWGISPADFDDESLYELVGYL